MTAIYLQQKNWLEAEQCLNGQAVIVLPLGASLKEHGHHLPLNNDQLIADFLTAEVGKLCDIVVLPTVNYSFYPAFSEYPGSVTLTQNTAASMIAEICLSIANFGPRKFYVLNTGVSTQKALKQASETISQLNSEIIFQYTDFKEATEFAAAGLLEQEGGGHADECETSMMLHIAPDMVLQERAIKDFSSSNSGSLTRKKALEDRGDRVYSPTGAWGDPTLATAFKGETIVNRLVDFILGNLKQI
ncbi:MAG: creatininase family protein [Leptolyngbya sp.]|nr:creatininase family protein [Candidatus Melainabacteria bacterium]